LFGQRASIDGED
jgi:hypothetical protein